MRRLLATAIMATVVAAGLVAVPMPTPTSAAEGPLAGRLILIDPGHQLGNSNPRFRKQMAQTRFNGTIVKGCNTTGTATNDGFPEATFTWRVATRLKRMLERAGARVEMTRSRNSYDAWGPCVWDRAKQANRIGADAMISIHADGAPASGRGFFVLAPGLVTGWTEDVVKPGRRLARDMIEGMKAAGATPSNYISGQLMVSRDTTSLNFSNVPTVTVELGNMRNAAEARRMSTPQGQQQYAQWLFAGIENHFAR